MSPAEEWRDILGFEGAYQASTLGRIRSIDRSIPNPRGSGFRTHKGRVRKFSVRPNGYQAVHISVGGRRRTESVHRLVALAFIGNPPFEGALVLHGNGVPTDNRPSNLRYGTQSENLADRIAHGTSTRGGRPEAKLSVAAVHVIRRARESRSATTGQLAKKFNVAPQTVDNVIHGRSWAWVPDPS